MAELTAKERKQLPASKFGLPETREYPIPDAAHARLALEMSARYATPKERKEVEERVHKLFPQIAIHGWKRK